MVCPSSVRQLQNEKKHLNRIKKFKLQNCNSKINISDSVKYLGITIDSHLN